jgi:hypothetical protein
MAVVLKLIELFPDAAKYKDNVTLAIRYIMHVQIINRKPLF